MFRKIFPQHPLARLYVGAFAVMSAIGVTVTVASMASNCVFSIRR